MGNTSLTTAPSRKASHMTWSAEATSAEEHIWGYKEHTRRVSVRFFFNIFRWNKIEILFHAFLKIFFITFNKSTTLRNCSDVKSAPQAQGFLISVSVNKTSVWPAAPYPFGRSERSRERFPGRDESKRSPWAISYDLNWTSIARVTATQMESYAITRKAD